MFLTRYLLVRRSVRDPTGEEAVEGLAHTAIFGKLNSESISFSRLTVIDLLSASIIPSDSSIKSFIIDQLHVVVAVKPNCGNRGPETGD